MKFLAMHITNQKWSWYINGKTFTKYLHGTWSLVRPAVREKKSLRDKVSLWFNNRHTLGPYRGLNQSEIVKGGPPSDWPWSRYSCTCVYVWYVCCCSQTEWEVSRDARSVANLATFSAFLDPHSIFLNNFFKATSDKSIDFLDKL